MDYAAFKDYLTAFLWKAGDAVLIANLDNLIIQGENTLNRELDDEYRHTSTDLTVTTSPTVSLPADYYSIRSVTDTSDNLGELKYVTPARLRAERAQSATTWRPIYSIQDTDILFVGPNASSTSRTITVDYKRKIGGYATDDASWLTTDNLDLLTYAVLYHAAPFLREDERVPQWQGMYQQIISVMNENAAHEKERGVYGSMPLPRTASGATRHSLRKRRSNKLQPRP